jgi:hypothetical protein
MALYALALILFLGIPFLLYCLWNFSRELNPRKTRVFEFTALPSWGSVRTMAMSRLRHQNASLNSGTKVVRRPDPDYPTPARVS